MYDGLHDGILLDYLDRIVGEKELEVGLRRDFQGATGGYQNEYECGMTSTSRTVDEIAPRALRSTDRTWAQGGR